MEQKISDLKAARTVKEWKMDFYSADPDQILAEIKGPRYVEYRRRWEKAGDLELIQNYPIHIDFELQYGCNFQCPSCILQIDKKEFAPEHPYNIDNRRKKVTFEKFCGIIDEGVQHGLFSITLNVNNEPLLTKDIDQYIRYAAQKGVVDIIMLTNASLLTQDMSHRLMVSGLTKLYFSLDAIREETYKVVRKGGDFKKTMTNIHYFLDLKKKMNLRIPVTRTSLCRSKLNSAEADEFLEYWKDKVDFVDIQSYISPFYEYSNYAASEQMLQVDNQRIKQFGPCSQPYRRLTIYNDGSVHPCCNWEGAKLVIGDIFSDTVYNIWNSETMKKYRGLINHEDESQTPKACQTCRKTAL